jgi:phage tail sheath protein FI
VKIADSLANGSPKNIPPSGHVSGVYARTDSVRNVAKAPAGISDGRLVGTIGYERTVSESDRDTVYPARINPLIAERQTGRCVWGARTLSLDKRWRYIQARRFFLFVEKSVFTSSWWSVFENIGPELFSRIQTNVRGFLRGLLSQGYFPTKKEEDAFLVVVDSTNNDDTSADNGEVIIDTFLAVNKPGEFIRFRFRQKIAVSA